MPDLHCVLDTCSLLKRYFPHEEGADVVREIFAHPRKIAIHFPDVCIAEARWTIFKNHVRGVDVPDPRQPSATRRGHYAAKIKTEQLKALEDDIVNRRLWIHHLTHRNIEDTKHITPRLFRYREPPPGEDPEDWHARRPGPTDGLVLSVAWALHRTTYGVILVTDDRRLSHIASRHPFGLKTWIPHRMNPRDVRREIQ